MKRAVNGLISLVGRGLRWSAWRWTVLEGRLRSGERESAISDHALIPAAKEFLQGIESSVRSDQYFKKHLDRIAATVALAPKPFKTKAVLEVGTYLHILPAVAVLRGYQEAKGSYLGATTDGVEKQRITSLDGKTACDVEVALFDAERDIFPYDDGSFDLVIVAEVLEHLNNDPMHLLMEARRVLCDGGALLLTTPNCASWSSLSRFLRSNHPYQFPHFRDPRASPEPGARHVREYTSREVRQVVESAGFEIDLFATESELCDPGVVRWSHSVTRFCGGDLNDRGDQIYCLARKPVTAGMSQERYPKFLYASVGPAQDSQSGDE